MHIAQDTIDSIDTWKHVNKSAVSKVEACKGYSQGSSVNCSKTISLKYTGLKLMICALSTGLAL